MVHSLLDNDVDDDDDDEAERCSAIASLDAKFNKSCCSAATLFSLWFSARK